MHIWTMRSWRSELLSLLSTQKLGIQRETLSVLTCRELSNINQAVAEKLYVNWHSHVAQEEPDHLPRTKMRGGNHHSALSRVGGKTERGRLTASWSQRLSLSLYNALSILDTDLPAFTIWKYTGKSFLTGVCKDLCFMEFKHTHRKIRDLTPANTVH